MLAAIIQARMGSMRLPGKSMMDLEGQPVLYHVATRASEAVKNVIIATTQKSEDDVIVALADKMGMSCFRGSENDVLDRYYQAAKRYGVDPVVRVTADNPLIDPEVIRQIIAQYDEHKYDFVSNCRVKITYPVGDDAEIFSFATLQKAWLEAASAFDREHVSPYIYTHPEKFRLKIIENGEDLSHLRWTVDTGEDMRFARYVYSHLYHGKSFGIKEVLSLYKGINK